MLEPRLVFDETGSIVPFSQASSSDLREVIAGHWDVWDLEGEWDDPAIGKLYAAILLRERGG